MYSSLGIRENYSDWAANNNPRRLQIFENLRWCTQ